MSSLNTAEEIWADLMGGKRRFVSGKPKPRQVVAAREELASGQHPQVIVLGYADSRVSLEWAFDKNLGELFVVRTADNVADPIALAASNMPPNISMQSALVQPLLMTVADRGQVIPAPLSPENASHVKAQTASDKLVLLVVEDHGSLCDMVSRFMMRHGYHVRTANNGASALEILSPEEIHLALLDLMLPKLDGFEVLRQVHKTQRNRFPYIIVNSAAASDTNRQKVLDLGANEYMPKTFPLNRLLERIQAVEKYLYQPLLNNTAGTVMATVFRLPDGEPLLGRRSANFLTLWLDLLTMPIGKFPAQLRNLQ